MTLPKPLRFLGRMAFDCPVTGGESGAIAGTLTAIVGATENDIAPVRDIIATFAANICCFDGAGKGQQLSLQTRCRWAPAAVGMADAMAFAELSGLDLEKTRQMIPAAPASPAPWRAWRPKALDGDYKPGFMVEHFIKDLRLALAYADDRELALPGADVAFTLYDMLDAIGGAGWVPRPSRSSKGGPTPSPPVWTGRSIVPKSMALTRTAAVAASTATIMIAVAATTMARTTSAAAATAMMTATSAAAATITGE